MGGAVMVELNPNIVLQGQNLNLADTYYDAKDKAANAAATQKIAEAESQKASTESGMVGLETVGRIAQGLLSLPEGSLNGQVVRQEVMANSHILPTQLVNQFLQRIDADPNADDSKIRQGLTQAVMAAQKPKDYYDKTVADANTVLTTGETRRYHDMDMGLKKDQFQAGRNDEDWNRNFKQSEFDAKRGDEDWNRKFQQGKEDFHRSNETIKTYQQGQQNNQARNSKMAEMEMKLADDHKAQSKDFIAIRDGYTRLMASLPNATKSAASTLAGATSFMKLLDPGSVVRESELGMALAASGVFDRMTNYFNVLQNGKVLTESQAKDFEDTANAIYAAAEKNQMALDNDYAAKAKAYGLDINNIKGNYNYTGGASGSWDVSNPALLEKAAKLGITPEKYAAILKHKQGQ